MDKNTFDTYKWLDTESVASLSKNTSQKPSKIESAMVKRLNQKVLDFFNQL